MKKFIFVFFALVALPLKATLLLEPKVHIDKKEVRNNVRVETGKVDADRIYQGTAVEQYNYPIQVVLEAILDRDNRCNNEFSEYREIIPKSYQCPFRQFATVESISHPIVNKKTGDELFVTTKQVRNRGTYYLNELATKTEEIINGKKRIHVKLVSIDADETYQLTNVKVKSETFFEKSLTVFELQELAPNKTKVVHSYTFKTNHWLVNKLIAAPTVFDNIQSGLNDFHAELNKQAMTILSESTTI